ncbi:MAG: FecR domain-containing protein [Marinifilum sp.]|jgi:hypothetical protein|nr:FecR domain-containing protein [Marinifilum sp.]
MKETNKYLKKAEEWAKIILTEEGDVSDRDRKVFESVKNGSYKQWRKENIHRFDKDRTKALIDKELTLKKSKIIQLSNWWYSVAAVFVITMLGTGGYYIYTDMKMLEEQFAVPGSSIAYLEVNQSEKFKLGAKDTIIMFQGAKVKMDSGKLVYVSAANNQEKDKYHTLNVPRNGEYFVQLPDGTKVWINSDSKLGFNSQFKGKSRVVELTGEAYFEVAKDSNKPFIVKTASADVKVLGTEFNVKAYADEEYTYATLKEGKVSVSTSRQNELLNPNEQLVINNTTGENEKRIVDASIYSAWVDGKLVFKDERLEDILLSLSRWYDVSVFYANESIKNRRFSISIDRYKEIRLLLDKMELTNKVSFEMNKNAVVVNEVN